MEELIAAVEKRHALYDKADDNYYNRRYVNKLWKEVGHEAGMHVQIARKKWTTLRDYFTKALKNMAAAQSGQAEKKKKWYLHDNMLFLLPHLNNRKPCPELSDPDSDDEEPISLKLEDDIDLSPPGAGSPASALSLPDLAVPQHLTDGGGHKMQTAGKVNFPLDHREFTDEPQPQTDRSGLEKSAGLSAIASYVSRKRKAEVPPQNREESIESDILRAIIKAGGISGQPAKEKGEEELFCQSLVPKLKLLDPLAKMECQAEIYMVVLRYIRSALGPQPSTSRVDYKEDPPRAQSESIN